MSFDADETNGISVLDNTNFDGPAGTITFWMQSSGTDTSASGNYGASLFCRPTGSGGNDFLLQQNDGAPGNITFQGPNGSGQIFTSVAGVSDDNWHFVALTFDQSASGGAALYIDGVLDTTNSNGGIWSWTAGEPLEIGYTSDPEFRAYNGFLDDVRYYSTELTASQIATIHNSGALADTADLQFQFN